MTYWDDIYNKLFGHKNRHISHKENFSQTDDNDANVKAWLSSPQGVEYLELVYKNYHFKKANINASPRVQIMNTPYANGFVVYFNHPFTEKSFSNLFFALGFRILDLGYQKISLDRRMQEINEQVKTTEKQYFKPPFNKKEENDKIDQLYGNISVENVYFDNKPSYITVLVTVYSDRLYQKAKSFDELIELIFNPLYG
ncbi:hypothetical protein [Anditalea andensis]|uniref:Uncharacterized protein n=1 Tax=Anditalea andensis TaxID=1048983 RepID=A0A074KYU4_9BACT|nr:hypothetical protein [Anditalea andensis]KEO75121.1 hypothetical protein EL17_05470 [Anditalea andensis]